MEELRYVRAEVLALRHVLEALWANFFFVAGGDPSETCRRIANESLESLEGIYERSGAGAGEGLHVTVQGILHHEESFWRSVQDQVETRLRQR